MDANTARIRLGITGHRPKDLGGYNSNNLTRQSVKRALYREIKTINPSIVVVGMAIGTDMDAADVCIDLGIPFIAAKPFDGQESRWNDEDRQHYYNLLSQAKEVHTVCQGGFASWKMMERNKWIVNNVDMMLGVYAGNKKSGTYNCLKYAHEQGLRIKIITPERVMPVEIKKQIATIVFAMFDEDAPADLDKAQEVFDSKDDNTKDEWNQYADSIITQMNNSGIVLLDRNDAAELKAISQRSENQLEGAGG